MKKILLLTILSMSYMAFSQNNYYVPTDQGNTWTYETDYDQSIVNVEINGYDGDWSLFSQFTGMTDQWLWTNPNSDNIYLWNGATYEKLFNINANLGTQYPISVISGAHYAEITDRSEVAYGFGTFETITLEFMASSARGPVIRSVTLADGLGVIAWTYINPADSISQYRMTEAQVNGTNYIVEETPSEETGYALSITAAFNKNFANTPIAPMGCPSCPVDPVVVEASITVTNIGPGAKTFFFSSSKTFDIEISSIDGRIFNSWSWGKMFTQATLERTLEAGQSATYTGTIELRDINNNGGNLPGGEYIIKIFVNDTTQSCVATAPFTLNQLMN